MSWLGLTLTKCTKSIPSPTNAESSTFHLVVTWRAHGNGWTRPITMDRDHGETTDTLTFGTPPFRLTGLLFILVLGCLPLMGKHQHAQSFLRGTGFTRIIAKDVPLNFWNTLLRDQKANGSFLLTSVDRPRESRWWNR